MLVIFSAAMPVMLTVLLGYLIARSGRPFDSKTITYIVSTIGTPVLVFYSLAHTTVSPQALAKVGGATILAISCFLIIGMIALKLSGLSLKAYLPSLSFPNTGNLGLPLSLYAFGDVGLNYAIAVFAVVAVSNHTIGHTIVAGRGQWRAVLTNPVIPAVILGVTFAYFKPGIPLWLDNTLELLAGLTIPLMLLMLGTSLARIPVTTYSRAVWLSVLRLGMGAVIGLVIAHLFGFTGPERGGFVLQCAMPVAVYSYVYAQMYDRESEAVASLVVVSTLISFITIPLLLSFLVE